ncbi:PREDICTED: uncharacterized protein LOC109238242 [Nicotiana attenuata]|uniref:uncharacterized protein LOC109238242 n=1 Tax=Nicotiana attenuata TaxID=49451 RepID=UPI000905642C|nr:PREDICTED: uncharacterized protein LOC109238242 [Nicotiana attenuata]
MSNHLLLLPQDQTRFMMKLDVEILVSWICKQRKCFFLSEYFVREKIFKAKDIPGDVLKGVPDFCTVHIISKYGKITSTRPASRPAPFVHPPPHQFTSTGFANSRGEDLFDSNMYVADLRFRTHVCLQIIVPEAEGEEVYIMGAYSMIV